MLRSQAAGAADANETLVKLRDSANSGENIILQGTYYEGQITVSWIDSNTLLIACEKCSGSSVTRIQRKEWQGTSVRYDGIPEILGAEKQ